MARRAKAGGRRIGTGVAAIAVALACSTPPVAAQNGSAWLTPKSPHPPETAGEVVVTVSMWRAGRVAYQTYDGHCTVTYSRGGSPPDVSCSDHDRARAPADYTATGGELVFTAGGSKTIAIPIVDDDLAEGDGWFTLVAWEEVNADPWARRGDHVVIRIIDDEPDPDEGSSSPPTTSTNTTTAASGAATTPPPAGAPTSGPSGVAPAPTSPAATAARVAASPATTTTTPPSSELGVSSPEAELSPAPGFELTREAPPRPAAVPEGGAGGSMSGLAIGSAIAVLGLSALAVVRRRPQDPDDSLPWAG